MQINIHQCALAGARVGEADTLEANAVVGLRAARLGGVSAYDRSFQEFVQGGQVQVVLIHAANRRQDGRDCRLSLAEQHQVHGHLAQRDAAGDGRDGDPCIGSVQSHGADQPQHEAPAIAAYGQGSVRFIQSMEDVPVAVQQQRAESEQFNLLHVVLTRQHRLEVQLHAGFG